jgi:hypothetical protein
VRQGRQFIVAEIGRLGCPAHRDDGLAVVTTADDLFLAQLASPAVAWPDGP